MKCDTLFDALIRAGKKIAIVAVANSSIDLIFRDRIMDYFSQEYDPQVTDKVIELIKADQHDVIIAYQQEYDDCLHKTKLYSEQAVTALKNHITSFLLIAEAFNRYFEKYNRLIAFTPDHGGHLDDKTQKGTHGLDIPEDMEVYHFYNVVKKQ